MLPGPNKVKVTEDIRGTTEISAPFLWTGSQTNCPIYPHFLLPLKLVFEKILSPLLSLECPSPPSHTFHLSPSTHHLPAFFVFYQVSGSSGIPSFLHPALHHQLYPSLFDFLPHSSTAISIFFHKRDMFHSFPCVFSLLCVFHPGCMPGSASLFTELLFQVVFTNHSLSPAG